MKRIVFRPNGKNRTPDVIAALLHAGPGTVLSFKKGQYDFFADGSYRGYFSPACNRAGDKSVVFPMLSLTGVTVDGGGSDFVFHDRLTPFIGQNSTDVAFRNFTVDFSFPRCGVGRVTACENGVLTLSFDDPNFRYSVNNCGNFEIKAGRDTFSTSERRFFLKQPDGSLCYLSAGDIYYENEGLPASVYYCRAEKTKDGVCFTSDGRGTFFPDFRAGDPLLISYDELRENDVFFFDKCKNVTVENVRVYHGAGMGVVGQLCENMTLDRLTVKPRDGELFSTTADAVLLSNFTGKVTMRDCFIDRTLDDGLSVHGFYARVERVTAENKATARMLHPSHAGMNPFAAGDTVTVSDGKTASEKCRLTVTDSYLSSDPYLIYLTFSAPTDGVLSPGDYLENPDRTPEVEVTGCTFRTLPAVRLGSAKKTVFRDCTVEDTNGLFINDLLDYWYASGPTSDVTVENCRFSRMPVGVGTILARPAESNVTHGIVTVRGCRFTDCKEAVKIERCDRLILSCNAYENCGKEVVCDRVATIETDE